MKRKFQIVTILMTSLIALAPGAGAQDDPYTLAMQRALEVLDQASAPGEFAASANGFERIASAEKEQWLPYYYAAYSLVVMSFEEQDGAKRDQILDRAQELLDQALKLQPGESELHVLQAFLYPSRIMVDPMGRGMMYVELMFKSLENAKALNEDNPRIYFLEGVNKLNLPPAMGGGADVARPILEEAMIKFKAFSNPDPLWPAWGEDATLAELEKLQ